MVNSDRYLGSDAGYKMQADALTNLSNATAAAEQKTIQGTQNFLSGAAQASQRLSEIQQQGYAAQAQAAARPNKFQQVADAGLQAYSSYEQNKLARQQALQKQQQDVINDTEYAKVNDKLQELTAQYQGSNWKEGRESYKYEADNLIKTYVPKNKEQAGYYVKLKQSADEAYRARAEEEGKRLQTEVERQRVSQVDTEQAKLTTSLVPVFARIASGGFDTQAQPLVSDVYNKLLEWKGSAVAGGIKEADADRVLANQLDTVNKLYQGKLSSYLDNENKLRGLSAGLRESGEINAKAEAGLLSYEEAQRQLALLPAKHPGYVTGAGAQLGDKEKFLSALASANQTLEATKKASDDKVIQGFRFADGTVTRMAALAYLDPETLGRLQNDPQLKDNADVKTAVGLAQQIQAYKEEKAKLSVTTASSRVELAKLDLSNIDNIVRLGSYVVKKEAQGSLSPDDIMKADAIKRIQQLDPGTAALLQQAILGQKLTPEDTQKLQTFVSNQGSGIEAIKKAIVDEQTAKETALYQKYLPLYNSGLVTDDATLQRFAKEGAVIVPKELERFNQIRLQQQQNLPQQQYGQQPNFNPSSSYAPVTDDKGKLVLVPRAKAQTVKLADGSEIVTPIIKGAVALPSANRGQGGGAYGAGRENGRLHAGQDFGLHYGDKAIALVSGTVAYVGSAQGYGNFIDIKGDNGLIYRYAHQQALVKPGQRVVPGQPVTTSNGSGVNVGGEHLHFEVRNDGTFDDSKYTPGYGVANTLDPIYHLKQLSAGASNLLTPRGDVSSFRAQPTLKTDNTSQLTSNGGVINAGYYQRVSSSSPAPVNQRFTGQRPVQTGAAPGHVKVGQSSYDLGDDLGYSELRKDSNLRKAFHDTAQRLGVPTAWIVDIARQEVGSINPFVDHKTRNQNYGLFGFGNDSGFSPQQFAQLRAGKIDGAGQLRMYEQYLKQNGWGKVLQQKQGNISIADLWAFTRMGWNMRQKFFKDGNVGVRTEGNLTYADELGLLGKWVGRKYDFGGAVSRVQRNQPVSTQHGATCPLCAQGIAAPHQSPPSDYIQNLSSQMPQIPRRR
jgi:murein DD-endopeptidase MepM/ murein hydrolase activator NlpD